MCNVHAHRMHKIYSRRSSKDFTCPCHLWCSFLEHVCITKTIYDENETKYQITFFDFQNCWTVPSFELSNSNSAIIYRQYFIICTTPKTAIFGKYQNESKFCISSQKRVFIIMIVKFSYRLLSFKSRVHSKTKPKFDLCILCLEKEKDNKWSLFTLCLCMRAHCALKKQKKTFHFQVELSWASLDQPNKGYIWKTCFETFHFTSILDVSCVSRIHESCSSTQKRKKRRSKNEEKKGSHSTRSHQS